MPVTREFGRGACGPEVLTLPALSWLPASPAGRGPGARGSGAPTRFGGDDSGRFALRVPGATSDRLRPVREKPGPPVKPPPHSFAQILLLA